MPRNNFVHVYAQELLHSYCRVKVVTIFVSNEECTSCWFSGVSTSRVPEPSPVTVAHNIFTRQLCTSTGLTLYVCFTTGVMLGYVASQLVKIIWIHNVINESGSNDIVFHLLSQKQIRNCSKEAVAITQNVVLNEFITADEAFTCVSQPCWSQTTFPSNMNTKL